MLPSATKYPYSLRTLCSSQVRVYCGRSFSGSKNVSLIIEMASTHIGKAVHRRPPIHLTTAPCERAFEYRCLIEAARTAPSSSHTLRSRRLEGAPLAFPAAEQSKIGMG